MLNAHVSAQRRPFDILTEPLTHTHTHTHASILEYLEIHRLHELTLIRRWTHSSTGSCLRTVDQFFFISKKWSFSCAHCFCVQFAASILVLLEFECIEHRSVTKNKFLFSFQDYRTSNAMTLKMLSWGVKLCFYLFLNMKMKNYYRTWSPPIPPLVQVLIINLHRSQNPMNFLNLFSSVQFWLVLYLTLGE